MSKSNQGAGLARAAAEPRINLVLGIERTVLIARYLACGALVVLFLSDRVLEPSALLPVLCAFGLAHNAFVHAAFQLRRPVWFLSTWNFCLHLAEVTITVALVGAVDSPLFVLYLLFIVGFHTYSRSARSAWLVTFACCVCYGTLVVLEQQVFGTKHGTTLQEASAAAAKLLAIVMGGWLTGALSGFLRETEIAAETRARALASSEATLRMILDSAEEPILTYNENELITDANEGACRFLDLPREAILGQRIRTFLFDDGTLPGKLATARAKGVYHGEGIVERPSGEESIVDMHIRVFFHDDRRFFVIVLQDITEHKALHEATRMTNVQLERVNRELQRVNALKSAFFMNVSRRLRSPLSAVLGFTDLLLNEEFGPLTMEQRQALQSTRRAVLRIFRLVDETFSLDENPDDIAWLPAEAAHDAASRSGLTHGPGA